MNLFDSPATVPFKLPKYAGYSLEYLENVEGFRILIPNGELLYIEQFFNRKISDRSVEYFQENDHLDWRDANWADVHEENLASIRFTNINWKQDRINMYGNTIPLPRLTAWYGDPGTSYTYSGITSHPNAWNEGLLFMKSRIEEFTGSYFNSVLLNWYRNGEDHLSWHSDDERVLGKNPVIASANFGETRDFLLRNNDDKAQKLTLPLKHGTLLVMRGALQHHWQHSVPKRKKVKGSRFNLTFRQLSTP